MDTSTTTSTEYTTVQKQAPTTVVKTTKQESPPVRVEHPQVVYQKKKAIFRTYQIIWYVLGLIEVLLIFRFALAMLGANPQSGFASLIYTLSAPLAVPFRGILPTSVSAGSVFEWSTIIAAIVYAIIAAGLVQLIQFFKPTNPQEVSEVVDSQ
jgi:YggT family protein